MNLTKMLTINKATFYINKGHIESLKLGSHSMINPDSIAKLTIN